MREARRHEPHWTRPARALLVLALTLGVTAPNAQRQGAQEDAAVQQLEEATQRFEGLEWKAAIALLDPLIEVWTARLPDAPNLRERLVKAYEMRGRSHYQLDERDAVRADFAALLRLSPSHQIAATTLPTPNPEELRILEEVRTSLIAYVIVDVTPADASVRLDGRELTEPMDRHQVVAGRHSLVAERPGYRRLETVFEVEAGQTKLVAYPMQRAAALVRITAVPQAVEVMIDGKPRGTTPLSVELAPGPHDFQFSSPCHVTERRTENLPADDVELPQVTLMPAVGTIRVGTSTPQTEVFFDGESKGLVPPGRMLELSEICAGAHELEMRSPHGREQLVVDIEAGEAVTIDRPVRPAFATLDRAAANLRDVLDGVQTISFAGPPPDVDQVLRAAGVQLDALANSADEPLGETLRRAAAAAAEALHAQGLALLTTRQGRARMVLLAAGSASPEAVEFDINDAVSASRTVEKLNAVPPLRRPSIGLRAIDIGEAHPVIYAVDPEGPAGRSGLQAGDVIAQLNGEEISTNLKLRRLLAKAEPGSAATLDVLRDGKPRHVELPVETEPQLMNLDDDGLSFNVLIAHLRTQLAAGLVPANSEPVVRLNLGAALIKAEAWAEARDLLQRVNLPDGRGVSQGTVQYFLGLCYEALGDTQNAREAWSLAAAAAGSTLHEDWLLVRDLALGKLAQLDAGGRGRPSPK